MLGNRRHLVGEEGGGWARHVTSTSGDCGSSYFWLAIWDSWGHVSILVCGYVLLVSMSFFLQLSDLNLKATNYFFFHLNSWGKENKQTNPGLHVQVQDFEDKCNCVRDWTTPKWTWKTNRRQWNMVPWNYQELNCMLGLWNIRTVARF